MKCIVKGYYNTGFNFNNVPDSPALLETVSNVKTFDSVYVKQDRDIVNLKLATTYNDIKDIDYLSISTSDEKIYYFVLSVNMVNDNVANLTLLEDVLTTEGGAANLSYIDGWCTRRCVTDDTLFSNVILEDFSPSTPLLVEQCSIGLGNSNYEEDFITVIASTIDLESENLYTANVFVGDSENKDYSVTVPNLPALTKTTSYRIKFSDNSYLDGSFPNVGLYILGSASSSSSSIYNDDGRIEKAIRTLRSLGLESVIVGSYKIPTIYIDSIKTIDDKTGQMSHGFIYEIRAKNINFSIDGDDGVKGFIYNYDDYTVKNNKVYSNYNNVTLFNRASGDSETYQLYDIYDSSLNNIITFSMSSDFSPNGCPFVRPKFFRGAQATDKTMLDNSVSGGQWLNTPIAFSEASGNAINAANFSLIKQQGNANNEIATRNYRTPQYYMKYAASSIGSVVAGAVGLSSSPVSGPLNMGKPGSQWDLNRTNFSPNISGMFSAAADVANLDNNFRSDRIAIENLARSQMYEMLQYELSQNVVAPDIKFTNISNIQIYWGNLFGAYVTRLSRIDLERFDTYLTRYGYKVSEKLTNDCFTGRENFNFVEAINVSIGNNVSLRKKNSIERIFSSGVRVWHKLPTPELLNDNPII